MSNKRGTSIIEVLVVMVVLLVGIMSVVRLFPPGFFAVRHAESITFATRLGQAELERLKSRAENLPAGVLPLDFNGKIWNGVPPGPRLRDWRPGEPGPELNNIETFRRIIGETTKIPVGSYFGIKGASKGRLIDYGSVYSLVFSPVAAPPPGSGLKTISIYGGNLRRRFMGEDDNPYRLRSYEYGIDYEPAGVTEPKFAICFRPVGYERRYRISYSWWESNGSRDELRSTSKELVIGPWQDWTDVPIEVTPGWRYGGIEEYSDSVARAFDQIAAGARWGPDPYEFKVVDYDTGVIAFNPYGYNATERTVYGPKILEAHIDYDIYDLEILREDKIVPLDPTPTVRLAVRYIKQVGRTTNLDGSIYEGFTLPSGEKVEMMLLDLNSGWKIQYPQQAITVDYGNGIVRFNGPNVLMVDPADPSNLVSVPIGGRSIRIFYQAEGDWRILVHKAYELYHELNPDQRGTVDYRSFDRQKGRLTFAACDIGKSVSVDYSYLDGNGVEHRVVGETHEIKAKGNVAEGYQGYIDLSHVPSRITAVYGISLKVRVIWAEGAHSGFASGRARPRYQWVDVDSTLTRKPYEV